MCMRLTAQDAQRSRLEVHEISVPLSQPTDRRRQMEALIVRVMSRNIPDFPFKGSLRHFTAKCKYNSVTKTQLRTIT